MVVPSIVCDDHYLSTRSSAGQFEFTQKVPTGLGIEHAFWSRDYQLAVAQPNRAEVTDAFASGRMQTDRIGHLGSNPHPAPGTVLLEVNFIEGPEIDFRIGGESTKFFCVPPVMRARLEQPVDAACANGTQVAGIVAGTDEP